MRRIVSAEAAFMVAVAAAAAVVAKNVRLFIVTSLEVLWNLANADQDSELPTGFVFKLGDGRSDVGNRSTNRTRRRAPPACYVADDTLATPAHCNIPHAHRLLTHAQAAKVRASLLKSMLSAVVARHP